MAPRRTTIHPQPKRDRYAEPAESIDYGVLAFAKNVPQPNAAFRAYCRQRCELKARVKDHRCSPRKPGTDYTVGGFVIDFCHTPASKGLGTKASDLGNGFGMCHSSHMEQTETSWKAFAKKYGIDPIEIAEEKAAEYVARFPGRGTE